MLGTYVSALVVVFASLAVGRALLRALGRREATWLEPAVGFAVLVVVGSVMVRLSDSGAVTAVALGALVAASLAFLRLRILTAEELRLAAGPLLIAAAVASLPFLANLRVGIPGVGINNDLASHLLWADWLIDQSDPQPVDLARGYPIGPHSVAAAVGESFGFPVAQAIFGLFIALPSLTALTALAILRELPPARRLLAAALVALPYLTASALAIGGFKEMAMSLLLLAFVLALARLERDYPGDPATWVSLGVLAAGALAVYSYPGLYWLIAAAGLLALAGLVRAHRSGAVREAVRRALPVVAVPVVVLLVLGIAELQRANTFRSDGEVGFVVGTDSKLREGVSPLEALGAWPDSNFLAGTAGPPAWWLFGALGVAALALALPWWLRRGSLAVPLAVLGVTIIYLGTLIEGGRYVETKALAVPAPLVMLLIVRGLLEPVATRARARRHGPAAGRTLMPGRSPRSGWAPARVGLTTAFVVVAALSSFFALRDAVIAPNEHADELAGIRDRVSGEWAMSLTADRYTDYQLRSAMVVSPARNVHIIMPARPGKDFRLALDFDTVEAETLDVVNWVLTTASSYRSKPPPNLRLVESTETYQLWKREGKTPPNRRIFGEEGRPGKRLECRRPGRPIGWKLRPTATIFDPPPVNGKRLNWEPSNRLAPGEAATQTIELAPGRWELSLQYHSPVAGLSVEAGEDRFELPAAMDGAIPYRHGQGPYWPVGEVDSPGGPLEVSVRIDDVSSLQGLLGVGRPAALGNLVAIQRDPHRTVPFTRACGEYVDFYTVNQQVVDEDRGAIKRRETIARQALKGRFDPRNLDISGRRRG